ncbi:hypothetical protein B0H67DRAFT_466906, partial [Lasiosphaeris hirsuta]
MSFLTETAMRRVAALQVPRTLATSAPRASFSTSIAFQKTATDSAKDALKSVDRAVSDKLVDGIDIGTTVASKLKETTENITAGDVKGKAAELQGEAKGKASEMAGKAKGAVGEMAGKAQGTAEEVSGR